MFRLTIASTFLASTLIAGLGIAGSSYNPPDKTQAETISFEQHTKAAEKARDAHKAELAAMQNNATATKDAIAEYTSTLQAAKEAGKEDKVAKLEDSISVLEKKLQHLYEMIRDREAQVRDFRATEIGFDKQSKDHTSGQRHIEELAVAYNNAEAKARYLNEKDDSYAAREYQQKAQALHAMLADVKAELAQRGHAKDDHAMGLAGGGGGARRGTGGVGTANGGGARGGSGDGSRARSGSGGGGTRGGSGGPGVNGISVAVSQDRNDEIEAAERRIRSLLEAAESLESGGMRDRAHQLYQEAEELKQRLRKHLQAQEKARAEAEHAVHQEHAKHQAAIPMERLERVEVAVKKLTQEVHELRQIVERIKQHLKERDSR